MNRLGGSGDRAGEGGDGGRPWSAGRRRPTAAVLVALILASLAGTIEAGAQAATGQAVSPEEELAQKFAPIAYLKRQDFACDPDGEPYLMVPVEVAFGDPAVALREAPGAREVQRGIGAPDLYERTPEHYVDLPGNPREPGCGYERHFRTRPGSDRPTVYAHVAMEPGKRGVAVQYWFWYYFNDFNDKHESDWEMIQLLFDADSVAEALTEEPVEVAFSQHKGGETAPWAGEKLRKEDGHPVTYPSRGSHGNYYEPGIWVGWGANRSGLGCDNTTGPSVRVAPEVRLVPDEIGGPDHPFAWAAFEGHWGQREAWVYDGPKGPNLNPRWTAPVTWQEGLRDRSLKLQEGDAVGPSPTGVFCALVRGGSDLYTQFKVYPWLVGVILAGVAALGGWLVALAWSTLRAAWRIYARHLGTFVGIGAVLIPVGLAANALHYLLVTNPPMQTLVEVTERDPFVPLIVGLTLGNFQHLALLVLVGPAVIQATADVRAGRRPSVRRAYGVAFARIGAVAGAGLRAIATTVALAVTVVGLPWAIFWGVRWTFAGQAVVLDGAGASRALAESASAVRGHWWRTLGILAVLVFVAAALGPLIGIPLMILAKAPLDLVNGLSGVLYAFTHPFAVVGGTLLYERLRGEKA